MRPMLSAVLKYTRLSLPYVDTMYITEVDHEFEGDAFFPEFSEEAFTIESVVDGVVDEKNTYPHRFVTLSQKGI